MSPFKFPINVETNIALKESFSGILISDGREKISR